MAGTLFFEPKNKRLAGAISIKSPFEFNQSIARVRALPGFSPLTKERALNLAKNRAVAQLGRKNLSPRERQEFRAIAGTPIPSMEQRDALRTTSDNMKAVYRFIDAAPFVDLPDSENDKVYNDVFHRFRVQKKIARRFSPEKMPVLNKLEGLCFQHKRGNISDSKMFHEIKKITLQFGLDQGFVNHVEQTVNSIKARRSKRPEKSFGIQPVQIKPFKLNNLHPGKKSPKPSRKGSGLKALEFLFGGGK